MTFKTMFPLLILSIVFLSHSPVLGMEEKDRKPRLISKEDTLSKEDFFSLRQQNINKRKQFRELKNKSFDSNVTLINKFRELGYHVAFNKAQEQKYIFTGAPFILISEVTVERLEQERKEAAEQEDPRYNENLRNHWDQEFEEHKNPGKQKDSIVPPKNEN